MQIEIQNRPMARGVTQLMYVGDDDAVENSSQTTVINLSGIVGAFALVRALTGPKSQRTGAGIVAAVLLAYATFPAVR